MSVHSVYILRASQDMPKVIVSNSLPSRYIAPHISRIDRLIVSDGVAQGLVHRGCAVRPHLFLADILVAGLSAQMSGDTLSL